MACLPLVCSKPRISIGTNWNLSLPAWPLPWHKTYHQAQGLDRTAFWLADIPASQPCPLNASRQSSSSNDATCHGIVHAVAVPFNVCILLMLMLVHVPRVWCRRASSQCCTQNENAFCYLLHQSLRLNLVTAQLLGHSECETGECACCNSARGQHSAVWDRSAQNMAKHGSHFRLLLNLCI